MGNNIGKSLQEENSEKIIKEIFLLSEKVNCKIIYPEDIVVGKNLKGEPQIKELNEIALDDMILDIGPKTIETIKNTINKSKTILWIYQAYSNVSISKLNIGISSGSI